MFLGVIGEQETALGKDYSPHLPCSSMREGEQAYLRMTKQRMCCMHPLLLWVGLVQAKCLLLCASNLQNQELVLVPLYEPGWLLQSMAPRVEWPH